MRQQKNSDLISTGVLNFADTKWETMSSETPYADKIQEELFGINMSQQVASQLDIVLCNPNEVIIGRCADNLLHNSLTRNNKYFPDHAPLKTEILFKATQLRNAAAKRNTFKKTDRHKCYQSIENELFQPYFYSNIEKFVSLW